MKKTYYRGDLYYADLGVGMGSEQKGYRPVVIIQNDVGNKYSPTTIVAPISTQIKSDLPTHCYLSAGTGLEKPSVIMLEQIRTVDKTRLGHYIGTLPAKQIRLMNHSLAVSVGLAPTAPNKLTLCLCSSCVRQFYNSGAFVIRKIDPCQVVQDVCSYCNHRTGYDYEISNTAQKRKTC